MNNTVASILIIDDDPFVCEKLKYQLRSISSSVMTSNSAENGRDFISLNKPTLIFLDNKLPQLQGVQVIQLFKKLSPKSKVILMSSNFDMNEVVLAIENKADYIVDKKKLTIKKLKETIDILTQETDKTQSIWRLLGTFTKLLPKQFKVAILEDDELFTLKLKKELEKLLPTYSVNSFGKGVDFLQYCQENSPQILLLDFHLPDYSGFEILDIVKYVFPKTKVIIMSGQNDSVVAIDLFQMGISGYIVKEFGWEKRLEACLVELNVK